MIHNITIIDAKKFQPSKPLKKCQKTNSNNRKYET